MTKTTTCPHNNTISCHDCRLSSLCLPIGLSRSQLTEVDSIIQQRPLLQKEQCLYHLHDTFSCIYAVRSGCIKTVITTENGDERVTGFYLPGDIVGIDGISEQRYSSSAIAIDTSSLCKIPFEHVEQLALQLPDLQRHMFKIMSREIVSDQNTLLILNKNKAESRMAAFLLSLSSRFQRQKMSSKQWTLPMSRGELGNYLGLTIETVSRVLTRMRKEDIISLHQRELTINNIQRLQHLAGI